MAFRTFRINEVRHLGSDISNLRTVAWKTQIAHSTPEKASSAFLLCGLTWRLELRVHFRGTSPSHFTISLCRVGNEPRSRFGFTVATFIQETESLKGDFQFNCKGFCKRNITNYVTTLATFYTHPNMKKFLYFQDGTEVTVVCVVTDMPPFGVLDRTTVEVMTQTDLDRPLSVNNIHDVKPSSDRCEQGSSNHSSNLDSSLSHDLGKLLEDKVITDVNLRCGGRTIAAHKAILAARSQVFSAMFQSRMSESETGIVDITDVDAQVLEMFLKYVYSGRLSDVTDNDLPSLFAAGDKYNISALKKECSERMISSLRRENCLEILLLASTHSDQDFKHAIFNFILNQVEILKTEEWTKFSKENPALSNEVFQFVVQRKWF